MNIKKWLNNNTYSLKGKCVAVTRATGGIGNELCRYLCFLNASLILMDRNTEKSLALIGRLQNEFSDIRAEHIKLDLSDIESVKSAVKAINGKKIDIIIHNAGAYCIPRYVCDTGLDNIFQINFASPYYLTKELLPNLKKSNNPKVIVVGSIAHNYSKIDGNDIDFSNKKAASKAYGNAKRFLMFSMYELFKKEKSVSLSVVHPGITFTNITAHYPKLIFAIIKHPMKIIFMKPKLASLSIVKGIFDFSNYHEWIGPRFFGIWGRPKKQKLKTCTEAESKKIANIAEKIYIKQKQSSHIISYYNRV